MKRRTIILLIISIISISLSSCSFLDDFLNNLTIDSYSTTSTIVVTFTEDDKVDTSTTTIITYDSSSETTSSSLVTTIVYEDDKYTYGYLDLANYENKDSLEDLYSDLYNKLLEFSLDFSDVNESLINDTVVYQIVNIEFFVQYGLTEDDVLLTLKVLELDHPEFYFISNEVRLSTKTIKDIVAEKTLYLYVDPEYHLGSVREEYSQNIETFYSNAILLINDDDDTELTKVRKVHDYIINNATYAFTNDGVTPSDTVNAHNIIGITSDGIGVCESYAELFTYILNRLGIRCITVTGYGYASSKYEAHAWNYVRINGKFYGFDLTWDDSTSSLEYYGFSSSNTDHIPTDAMGIKEARLEYLYILPDLSTTNLDINNH